MTISIDRRAALGVALAAGAVLATGANAQTPAAGGAKGYSARPLPFDPKTIPGLSEKLLVSHHDNNYVGAVNRIAAIETQVAGLDPASPGFLYNGLKREELIATNSMILHELYFNGLGKGGSKPGGKLAQQIESDFGSQQK